MFDAKTYLDRRRALLSKLDKGLILFHGNHDSPKNYQDNIYTFRQDSSFLYFAGLDRPGLALLLDIEAGTSTLYGSEPTMDTTIWMGDQPGLDALATLAAIDLTADYGQLGKDLAQAQKDGRDIHFLPPYRGENILQLCAWLGKDEKSVRGGASEALIRAVVDQVSHKSSEEVAEMEKAVNITGAMHTAAMRAARPGMTEAELTGIVHGIAVANGGDLAYPVIMTVNGQVLHNHEHHHILKPGQLVLGDYGAETSMHYAGDITRTLPVDATFTPRQRDIYQIVLEAENSCIEALKPGVAYRDMHLKAAGIISRGLIDLGLMKGDPDEAVSAGAHALFFPHGLGHMIGLDVHDMEGLGEDYVGYDEEIKRSEQFGLRSLRLGRKLEPGFVLTVEPGIYFIPELIELWKSEGKFADFIAYDQLENWFDFSGVRIEDNVLITDDGHRLLGNPIPKKIAEVEALRKEAFE